MSAVIYARKSSESEDRQVQSLDDQLGVLRSLARDEGIPVEVEYVESKSAKDPYARPEFERLIRSIEGGKVSQVYVWALNRLSRNPVDGGRIAHLLQTGKLRKIVTPVKVYDSEDSALLLAVENGMSTAFIQDLRRNVKRGLASKAEKGWAPYKAKLGYKNNLETREIDPDPRAFDLVKQGWHLFLEGWTVNAIEAHLRSLGLHHHTRGQAPQPLRKGYLYRVFSEPFYAGFFRYNGELRKGAHTPMITEEEFALAQRRLKARPSRAGTFAPKKFTFGGIFRCSQCGCAVTAQTKRKYDKDGALKGTYTYYHCTGHKGCQKTAVRAEVLEEAITSLIDRIALPEWLVELAQADVARMIERDLAGLSANASEIEGRIGGIERRLSRLLNLRLDDTIDQSEFEQTRKELLAEKARESEQLELQASYVSRSLSYLDQELTKCVRAHEYSITSKEALLIGMAQTLRRDITFVPGGVKIQPQEPLGEIIRFRPLILSSVSRETSDFRQSNCIWQAFCDYLHTIARLNIAQRMADLK
ncbi:MAG TPA: recombinase family protein [Fimbriimonadaceae bacterium]|nr:recombinase family protein [Fimbriimonadaceae bacterium]